jgi:hypothetical protein
MYRAKHTPKILQSDHYHVSEDDAKFEAAVASIVLQIFSLLCKASCRIFYIRTKPMNQLTNIGAKRLIGH